MFELILKDFNLVINDKSKNGFAIFVYSKLLNNATKKLTPVSEIDGCYFAANQAFEKYKKAETEKLETDKINKAELLNSPELVIPKLEITKENVQEIANEVISNNNLNNNKTKDEKLLLSRTMSLDKKRTSKDLSTDKASEFQNQKSVSLGRFSKVKKSSENEKCSNSFEIFNIKYKKSLNPFTEYLNPDKESSLIDDSLLRKYPNHLPLKLIIFGPSFSQKHYIAKHISEKFNLKLISVEETITELIRLNQENAIKDNKVKEILENIYNGKDLTDDHKIYLIQRILLFSFDNFESDEDFALEMMNHKTLAVLEQAKIYEQTKREKKKRLSRFWKNPSQSQEFFSETLAFERISAFGFVLFDFPDKLSTAIELERILSGFVPENEVRLNPTQNVTKLLDEVYVGLKENLIAKINEKEDNTSLNFGVKDIFKVKTEHKCFFDAVIQVTCTANDSYKRAFENFQEGNLKSTIQLRDQSTANINQIDFGVLKSSVKTSDNCYTLWEGLKHQELESARICDFYQHFRRFEGAFESIIYSVDDSDLTSTVEKVNGLVEEILNHKTVYYNSVLNSFLQKKAVENSKKETVLVLFALKKLNSKTNEEIIKSNLERASENIRVSQICIKKNQVSQTLVNLWFEGIQMYKTQICDCLSQFQLTKSVIATINNLIFEKYMQNLLQTDDRDLQVNNFVKEYNEFSLKFPDLSNLVEVKAEFQLRLN